MVGPPRAKEIQSGPCQLPFNFALPQTTALQLGSTTISKKSDSSINTHHTKSAHYEAEFASCWNRPQSRKSSGCASSLS
jgi:hypothetical protein